MCVQFRSGNAAYDVVIGSHEATREPREKYQGIILTINCQVTYQMFLQANH